MISIPSSIPSTLHLVATPCPGSDANPTKRRCLRALQEDPTPVRASQVGNVAAEEIEFFFTSGPDDEASPARGIIAGWIAKLAQRDQDALALYFEREPWPESIREERLDYERGYALVLANASAYPWRPKARRCYRTEQIASDQLRAAVYQHGPGALRGLTRRAEWEFDTALRAYIHARGRAPSALADLGVKGGAA